MDVYISASIYTSIAGMEIHFEDVFTEFEPAPNQLLKRVDNFLEEVSYSIASAMIQEADKNNISDVTVELDINGFDKYPLVFTVQNPIRTGLPYTVKDLETQIKAVAEEFAIFEIRPDIVLFLVSSEEFENQ